jgi:hypothetical protein
MSTGSSCLTFSCSACAKPILNKRPTKLKHEAHLNDRTLKDQEKPPLEYSANLKHHGFHKTKPTGKKTLCIPISFFY